MLVGCGRSKQPRYYLLYADKPMAKVANAPKLTVGVGPFEFPEYLDRVDIVQREKSTRLKLQTTHLWAEPLSVSFVATTVDNLGALLGTERVVPHPWDSRLEPDVMLEARVTRFDVTTDGMVTLVLRWSVVSPPPESGEARPLVIRRGEYTEKSKGKNMDKIVEAMSRAVLRFCEDAAKAIHAQRTN